MENLKRLLSDMGPLRVFLIGFSIILILFRPAPGTPVSYEGWGVATTLLFPVLTPIFFMLLMLDALMSKVFMAEKPTEQQLRFRLILRINLVIGIALLLYWLPYFYYINK